MIRNGGQSVLEFKYNADGIHTSKIVNNVEHIYTLNGSQIVSEAWGDILLIYLYDESGSPIGMQYRKSSYAADVFDTFYFEKNLQGDIIAIYTESGRKILEYTYDAWGNHSVTWTYLMMETLPAVFNPFRYRGYYYDTETQLYYLQSRYYNPAWGRFLNEDGVIYSQAGLIGYNMYAYCGNNPVMGYDPSGYAEVDIKDDEDGNPINDFGPVYKGSGKTGVVRGRVDRMTKQMKNKIKNWITESRDICFPSRSDAVSFVQKNYPTYPQEVRGGRSAYGWHFDQHLSGDTREHINLYDKHIGFNAHLYWNSLK